MNLENIARLQRRRTGQGADNGSDALLLFENRMQAKSNERMN